MDKPDREVELQFTHPWRQLLLMTICIAVVASLSYLNYSTVMRTFTANVGLNGLIVLVFFIGVLACLWQVIQVFGSVSWIERFVSGASEDVVATPPPLLAPLATLLKTRGMRMQIGTSSSRSILDSVAQRIDEDRDITRYIVNLLIFLGLLGTFYGLATTVPAVVDTIKSLTPKEGESSIDNFPRLLEGLGAQLNGMGVAFSSSLLGLAGSLIVGLLELFASHGQNRFYRELEEWMSSITRLGFSSGDAESGHDQGAASVLLEHFAEQMDSLQTLFVNSDISRALVDERLGTLATSVDGLVQRLDSGNETAVALSRVADGQQRLIDVLEDKAETIGEAPVDAESRMRLRSIDVQLLRILEEMSAGRQESLADLRTDLAALTKSVRTMARNGSSNDGRGG